MLYFTLSVTSELLRLINQHRKIILLQQLTLCGRHLFTIFAGSLTRPRTPSSSSASSFKHALKVSFIEIYSLYHSGVLRKHSFAIPRTWPCWCSVCRCSAVWVSWRSSHWPARGTEFACVCVFMCDGRVFPGDFSQQGLTLQSERRWLIYSTYCSIC